MPGSAFELKDEVVRAGAGAGKTTALTRRVIEAAKAHHLQHGKYPKVVVTTFTRKATQELRERLMAEAGRSGDRGLLEFTGSKAQLFISTIHGVLSQFLNRYGYLSEIDPGYRIESSAAIFTAAKKILREVIFSADGRQEILEKFDFDRLCRMVLAYSENRYLFADLQPHNVETFSCLYRERTASLAEELRALADKIESEAETDAWREYASGLKQAADPLKQEDLNQQATGFLRIFDVLKKPRRTQKTPGIGEELAEEIKDFTGRCRRLEGKKKEDRFYDLDLWPRFFAEFAAFAAVAEDFHLQFHAQKMNSGQLDMSDLEAFSWRLLQEHPEAGKQFVNEWDYWLIDEYQDTSPVQVRLLKRLVGNRPSFTVGDPQQSIYIFRGAHSELFAEREHELVEAGGEVGFLQKNYRSEPPLLEFFNDFFTKLGSQFSRMEPKEPVQSEDAEKTVATFSVCRNDSEGEEFGEEFCSLTGHLDGLISRGARLDQICILGRTNRRLEKTAMLLGQLGYPVHLHSSSGFYSRREILDATSFLKFLSNPHDDQNLVQLLRSPWFRIADSRLARFCQRREGSSSLWWSLQNETPEEAGEPLDYLRSMLKYAGTHGYALALQKSLDDGGLFDWSRYVDSTGRRESNLWKLIARLTEEERKPGFNINEFVESPRSQMSTDEGGEESDAVAALEPNRINLMTVHASKGLQFDHVVLPELHRAARFSTARDFSLSESRYWSIPVFDDEDHSYIHSLAAVADAQALKDREMQEQERLLYVALTRAKKSVYMSWQQSVQRSSLAHRIRWNLEAGEHRSEKYSYAVKKDGFQLTRFEARKEAKQTVRPLYAGAENSGGELRPVSVSQLLQEIKAPVTSASSQKKSIDSFIPGLLKTREGVRIHRLFELLRHIPREKLEAAISGWQQENPAVAEAVRFVFALEEPPMKKLLQSGHVEWGFVCRFENLRLEGQIDLWGVADGKLWLVDYKTGNPLYVDKAFQQLALYAHALRISGQNEEIELAVVYPMDGKVFSKGESEWRKILENIKTSLS